MNEQGLQREKCICDTCGNGPCMSSRCRRKICSWALDDKHYKANWIPIRKKKSVAPLPKVKVVLSNGFPVVMVDEGQNFDRILKQFYEREDINLGLIAYLVENKIKMLDTDNIDLDEYQEQYVLELRAKLKKIQAEKS